MRVGKTALVIIISMVLFQALINYYIFKESKIVRCDDEGGYIYESIIFHQNLINKQYKDIVTGFWGAYVNRGLISYAQGLILTLLNKLGLKDIDLMILSTNSLFLFILLLSTYRIGSILYNERVGLLSAVLISLSPQIFGHSRVSLLDFPTAAMVSLSMLCLLKTDYFRSLFFSLLSAVVFILAEFTKETAFVFIFPVFLFYFFKSLSVSGEKRRKFINFGIILLSMLLRMAVEYLSANHFFLHYSLWKIFYKYNQFDYFYYFKGIPYFYLGIIFSIFLIPPFLSYLYNFIRRNIFLFIWFFASLVLFSVFPNRTIRFFIPALPPLFLLLTAEIVMSPFKAAKPYCFVLIASAIFQYTMFCFFPNAILPNDKRDFGLASIRKDKDFYKIRELLDIFKKEQSTLLKEAKVVSTFYSFHGALQYELRLRYIPFDIDCPQSADTGSQKMDWEEYLMGADYVLDKTGDLGAFRGNSEDVSSALQKALEHNLNKFIKIAGFKIEGDEYINLYKRIR